MDFIIEADLGTYSEDELHARITEGTTALDALLALEDPSDDDVSAAETIAVKLASLRTEVAVRISAAAERAERMSAVRAAQAEPEPQVDEPEVDDTPAEPETEVEEAAPARQPARTGTRAAVAASARRPVLPVADAPSRLSIIASADVPGFATGSAMDDLDAIGEGFVGRMRAFPPPAGIEGGQMSRYPVAQLRRTFSADLITDGGGNDQDVVDRAANESRLPGGSLTAAGGWCAPSETLYDLCAGETTEGLLSLPEIQVRRGGIRYTNGPSFADIFTDTGFTQTEAQAIAGTVKPCYEVECPPFVEVRLDAVGFCVKAPLLTNAAYPELIRRILSGALVAHQARVSIALINKIVTAAGAAEVFGNVGSGASNVLDAVELAAENLRAAYRLSLRASLQVLAPHWLKAHIRADLANKSGVNNYAISDADIDRYFAARSVSVQFVYGWQPLASYIDYPATVNLVVFPAGTFVKGVNDVISLDAVYDAASLSTNTYTAAFVEEGVLIAQRCYAAKLITVPLCAGGLAGANTNADCLVTGP